MRVAHSALRPTRLLRPLVASTLVVVCCALATTNAQSIDTGSNQAIQAVERQLIQLEGFVLDPGGQPVEGAVVASSAGGRASTDLAGYYSLETAVPLGAQWVQISGEGVKGSNLVVTRDVAVPFGSRTAWVDPMTLQLATSCVPSWLPTFDGIPGVGSQGGSGGYVYALAEYDDGGGTHTYIGGNFSVVGGILASSIAKWDGANWVPLGAGISGEIYCMAVYDDGTGPKLYVGGSFSMAGGASASNIAQWDGTTWAALGTGVNSRVYALGVYEQAGTSRLYLGGDFSIAGGVLASRIASWDGSTWAGLGSGVNSNVYALTSHDDGTGSQLYVGGQFNVAGGNNANRIAKWDGANWSPLSTGMDWIVESLAVYDDGAGPELYAGGAFNNAGFFQVNHVARWDGLNWFPLGSGITGSSVRTLAVYDDGNGPRLYAGGEFSTIKRWESSQWDSVGSTDGVVRSLVSHETQQGSVLVVGGEFSVDSAGRAYGLTKWNGLGWSGFNSGLNGSVQTLAQFDDGNGPSLYAGGHFTNNGLARFGKWNGTAWEAVGQVTLDGPVYATRVHDDGSSGQCLYVGGGFSWPGGRIARWDGTNWSAPGNGFDNSVRALEVYDAGAGPMLYAAGLFASSGGTTMDRIARWNGGTWSPLGFGLRGPAPYAMALAVFDDGTGPALYAGGNFVVAGLVSASNIAKWDGASWSRLGSGLNSEVHSLAVYDDGGGPKLFVGGFFTTAGGISAVGIATWDGMQWASVDDVQGAIQTMAVHNDGSGSKLYAGGSLYTAGGMSLNSIASFDGMNWAPVGSGMSANVYALGSFDFGGGSALYAGGTFASALDSGDSFLAKWGCPDSLPPTLACPESVQARDKSSNGPGEIVHFVVNATDNTDPNPDVVCVPPSGSFFSEGTTTVECTATDSFGNQASCSFPVVVTPAYRLPADAPATR